MLSRLFRQKDTVSGDLATRPVAGNAPADVAALQEELALYKAAFTALGEVARRVKAGDMEARIVDWDQYGPLNEVLAGINHVLDFTDSFIRESTASLSAATSGRFYRKFLTTGMAGSFANGARFMNTTSEELQRREEERVAARLAIARTFEANVGEVVSALGDALHKVADISVQLKS